MDNQELYDSHDMIKDADQPQWDLFEKSIHDLKLEDLAEIATDMGATPQETWEEYRDTLASYEWYEFARAFNRIMGRDFV